MTTFSETSKGLFHFLLEKKTVSISPSAGKSKRENDRRKGFTYTSLYAETNALTN